MKEPMIMSIASPGFAPVRESFDRTLAAVFKKMQIRDANAAKIQIAADIRLEDIRTVDAVTGEIIHAKNPLVKYKVSHKLDYRGEEEESGEIQQADSYLVCEEGTWKVRQADDGQMSISDYVQQGGKK